MKKYNCYACGAFLKVHKYKESDIKDNQDKGFIGSVDLVCNNKKCSDYGKHHLDNLRDEE